MTSPSISGHQRISLNDGNILLEWDTDSILVTTLLLIPKDATLEEAEVAATASVAMMIY